VILVDTSVWVEHLRRKQPILSGLLERELVLCHPFVIGELACGTLRRRDEVLSLLSALPQAPLAGHDETLVLLERRGMAGRGIGWIDVHLLASAMLGDARLWTLDRRLAAVAKTVGVLSVDVPASRRPPTPG
jgi:predicted nucleic acid-binding protein